MSQEFEKYEQQRENLEKETNSRNFTPISFEIFRKSPEEREEIKQAKKLFKKL